jgi:elongation factor 1 alpha-like protein
VLKAEAKACANKRLLANHECYLLAASGNSTAKQSKGVNSLQKKTEKLSLEQTPAAPAQPKVKSKNLDVPKLWAEVAPTLKPSAAFVVIGHVDHGKSTLMGRLLLDTGAVPQRDIDKYRKEATEKGKGSFALAWVMDTSSDERERGVTVDIAQHHFSTDKADFTILDAPGHRDFVPNMIGGAAMADLGVLVVDANQLESGLRGQTKEHVLLARAVGLERMIVAVNKMDGTTPEWNQGAFEEVSAEVKKLLQATGFEEENIKFVPCSGLNGDNVAKAPSSSDSKAAWVAESCETLTSALEAMAATVHVADEAVKGPLRMQITDIFRGGVQNPFSVSGRIASGNVQAGDSVQVQPRGEQATVKSVEVSNEPRDYAVAGQLVTLHLDSSDMESLERNLRAGDTLCSASKPVAVVKEFEVNIDAIGTLLPSAVDVHVGRLHVPGRIVAMSELREKFGGEIIKKKPRVVQAGQVVKVKVAVEEGVAVEHGTGVVLRSGGETVGRGLVC